MYIVTDKLDDIMLYRLRLNGIQTINFSGDTDRY